MNPYQELCAKFNEDLDDDDAVTAVQIVLRNPELTLMVLLDTDHRPSPMTLHHEWSIKNAENGSVVVSDEEAQAAVHVDDEQILVSRGLLGSFIQDDDCWFDRPGGCQAHGYLSLAGRALCPQEELKRILHINGR